MKGFIKKRITVCMLAAILVFTFTACGKTPTSEVQETETEVQETQTETTTDTATDTSNTEEVSSSRTIMDRNGIEIIIPEKVETIVSMAPSITETLVHMGLADKIVAIDKYSEGIEGLKEGLPVYDIMAPDTESLAKLQPDIIFASGMSNANEGDPFKPVTDLGVLMTYIPSANSIEGIKEDIIFLGEVTGKVTEANAIVADMDKQINDIVSKIGENKGNKTVYFEIGSAPNMYSFGQNTFLNEIIGLLGCENILADQDSWVAVSEEAVLTKNPDIIFTNVDYVEDPVLDITGRNGWDALNAVKEKQVFSVAKNASSRPNEFVIIAIDEMANIIYPELFN